MSHQRVFFDSLLSAALTGHVHVIVQTSGLPFAEWLDQDDPLESLTHGGPREQCVYAWGYIDGVATAHRVTILELLESQHIDPSEGPES